MTVAGADEETTLEIGSRRELFVDHYLFDRLDRTALKLHHPQETPERFHFDKPWEGPNSGAVTVIKDGDVYRMYYQGTPVKTPGSYICYAESNDGIHWRRPELGLIEFQGSRKNNILGTFGVLEKQLVGANDETESKPVERSADPRVFCFTPFLDTRPGIPESERFKAVGLGNGLRAFVSQDGIHWQPMSSQPVITKGLLDAQNVAFYSEAEKKYVCYFRAVPNRTRWVARSTSTDFINWSEPALMTTGDRPREHLYGSPTTPYFRAPHIYIALPSRFMDGRDAISQEVKKQLGLEPFPVHYSRRDKGQGFNDMPLLTSRGGNSYQRTFMESFIRPGLGPKNWTSRGNYPAYGIVPTPDSETHLSIYVQRHGGYASAHVARFTLRHDGFISVHAPFTGGEMITKPLRFEGRKLTMNYVTSAPGWIRVEVQDASGKPIPGFRLTDCPEIVGDEIDRVVQWRNGADVSALAGKPIRLRFVMKAADLYSIRFVGEGPTLALETTVKSATDTRTASADTSREAGTDTSTEARSVGETMVNSIGMKLRRLPAGSLVMGSESGEPDERPRHQVALTKSFFMGVHEVTQEQYETIMGANPSYFKKGGSYPVERVSWDNAVEFCKRLSSREDRTYRLPTEAEWEYACRAGTTTPFAFGETITTEDVNYNGSLACPSGSQGLYRKCPTPVGSFRPNAWGLYDMHGNVWEWCQDRYANDYYARSPAADPPGAGPGDSQDWGWTRTFRGGSWDDPPKSCRSTERHWGNPKISCYFDYGLGFRVVCESASDSK
jgi:formylglycine-generating enzyme required for sulfatase activity